MEERREAFQSSDQSSHLVGGSTVDAKESLRSPELKVSPGDGAQEMLPSVSDTTSQASIHDLTKAMPSQRKEKVEEAVEPLTKLPRVGIAFFYAMLASLAMILVSFFAANGMPRAFLMALPVQIYFAHCMLRLSDVIALKTGRPPSLPAVAVTIISLVSLACFPVFGEHYHFPNRLFDPFFWVWMSVQWIWPMVLSNAIERKFSVKTVLVTLTAAAPVFIVSSLPILFNVSMFFLPLWLFTQFACVVYLNSRMQQVFADDLKVTNAKLAASRMQVSGATKDDIVVQYKPYAAIERWIRQRLTGGDLVKGVQLLLLWVSVPVVILALLIGLTMLDNMMGTQMANDANIPKKVAQAAAAVNASFLGGFLSFVSVLVVVPLIMYLRAPTHLLFNRSGLRFLWRHGGYSSDGAQMSWKNLQSIDLERAGRSTKALDQLLVFNGSDGHKQKLKLSAFETMEDREKILAMIRSWAPNVPRPPEVEQCLEPPANHSYTEMWLQALAAPPKRERLKPLIDGASLQSGKYKVENQLGVGGQGSAYLVNDNINDRVVVLKEFILPVHVDVNVRKSALESFENEARILKQMDNPGVVKLIDFFVEDHRAYLVLEHIDGMSLRELVEKNGAMKESQVKELAMQMCDILSYLHSLSPPVVHRDFTPDNLILQRDGKLKLIDFNVAQQVEATVTGTVVGKHAYLPPEQFRGMPTGQSDIYACGATLHFLLTGADPEPISQSHPQKQVPSVSQGLDHIIAHATHLDTGQRYDKIEEMANELKTMT